MSHGFNWFNWFATSIAREIRNSSGMGWNKPLNPLKPIPGHSSDHGVTRNTQFSHSNSAFDSIQSTNGTPTLPYTLDKAGRVSINHTCNRGNSYVLPVDSGNTVRPVWQRDGIGDGVSS